MADMGGQPIRGLSDPLTDDLNAAGNSITNAGPSDVESLSIDKLDGIEIPEDGEDLSQYDANGVTLLLPADRVYSLSSPWTSSERVTIMAAGALRRKSAGEPVIVGPGGTDPVFDWSGANTPVRECHLQGIQIDANGGPFGINAEYLVNQTVLRDLWITGDSTDAGLRISKSFYASVENVTVRGSFSGDGMRFEEGAGAINGLPVWRPVVKGPGSGSGKGIVVSDDANVGLYEPLVEDVGLTGIELNSNGGPVVTNPYLETYGSDQTTPLGIDVLDAATITGGFYTGATTSGIQVRVPASGNAKTGSLRGGSFIQNADYHILNEVPQFTITSPRFYSGGSTARYKSAGAVFGAYPASNGQAPVQTINGYLKASYEREDLTTRTPQDEELAYHNGASGEAAGICFELGGNWYNIRTDSTF